MILSIRMLIDDWSRLFRVNEDPEVTPDFEKNLLVYNLLTEWLHQAGEDLEWPHYIRPYFPPEVVDSFRL